jgi:hypothetical protein
MDENWEVFLHFRTPPTGDKWNSPGYWLTLIMMIYDDHGMLCKTCRVCGIAPWRCRLQQRSTKVRCCICQDGNHDRCSSRPLPKTEPHFRNIKKNEDHWLFGTISIFHLNSSYSQFPWFRDVIVQNHIRDSTFPPRDGCTPGCQSGSPNSAVPRWARFPRRWHHWRMVFMVKQGIVSHLDYWKSLDKHIFYIIIYIYTQGITPVIWCYMYIYIVVYTSTENPQIDG